MSTLYRKYRPQTFAQVSGQEHIKQTIQNEIKLGKISHAYLFCGPRGIGKTTMARLLAKSANCINRKNNDFEPCNQCEACEEIKQSKSLDVIEIDAASNTGVDHVREHIINAARFVPTNRKYKIFIIDEVHMLSTSAFNALLKILEEPPEYVKFILATTEIHKILPTIISRCQRFDFKKIDYKSLFERLSKIIESENKKVDDNVIDIVISKSDGCLRDAESLLGQLLTLDDENITIKQAELILPITNFALCNDLIENIANNDLYNSIKFLNTLTDQGYNIEQFNKDLIEYIRKILLYKIQQNIDDQIWELDEVLQNKMIKLSDKFEIERLIKMLDLFIKALQDSKHSPIVQLPLELAIVELLQNKELEIKKVEKKQEVDPEVDPAEREHSRVEEKEKPQTSDFRLQTSVSNNSELRTQNSELQLITFDDIKSKWLEVQDKIRIQNYSLSCVFSAGVPLKCENNCFTLAFKHAFNQEKMDDVENRKLLEDILIQIFNQEIKVQIIHDKNIENGVENSNSITLGEVLKKNREDLNGSSDIVKENLNKNDEKKIDSTTSEDKSNEEESTEEFNKVLDIFGGSVEGN